MAHIEVVVPLQFGPDLLDPLANLAHRFLRWDQAEAQESVTIPIHTPRRLDFTIEILRPSAGEKRFYRYANPPFQAISNEPDLRCHFIFGFEADRFDSEMIQTSKEALNTLLVGLGIEEIEKTFHLDAARQPGHLHTQISTLMPFTNLDLLRGGFYVREDGQPIELNLQQTLRCTQITPSAAKDAAARVATGLSTAEMLLVEAARHYAREDHTMAILQAGMAQEIAIRAFLEPRLKVEFDPEDVVDPDLARRKERSHRDGALRGGESLLKQLRIYRSASDLDFSEARWLKQRRDAIVHTSTAQGEDGFRAIRAAYCTISALQ